MKRFNSALLAVLVTGSVVAVATPVTASEKAGTTKVTVSGCVATGERAGQFVLTSTEPVLAPEPVATGTTGAPILDRPAAMEHQPSYALKGDNLKEHLGHKVEVTGTTPAIAETGAKAAEASPATPTPTPTTGASTASATSAPLAILDVTTIKMIAATCS